jgi:DedD protein
MANPDDLLPQTPQDDDAALRKKLLSRVGIAGAVIVALVGALMLFDTAKVNEAKLPAPVAAVKPIAPPETPVASEAKPDADRIAEPAEARPEEPKVADARPVQPATAPRPDLPEPPVIAAEPERTETPRSRSGRIERPLTVPAAPRQAAMRPTEPVVAKKPELQKEAAKEVARVMPPVRTKESPAPASRPIARAVESARQFLVQVGVFGNLANAEELRARLENAGVPAHIEARVQVGPFASREEAERAREKMKAIGVEPGIIMTRK